MIGATIRKEVLLLLRDRGALASMFLITPGIITDTLGILILFPPVRGIFKELTVDLVRKKISRGEVYYFFKD